MTLIIQNFISELSRIYKTGAATEHSYRSAIQQLFEGLSDKVTALNEPKRVKCGAPDFIFYDKQKVEIGWLEAKDLHIPIQGMKGANKNQQERYKHGFPNLIYTNGLDWDFYRNGAVLSSIQIGTLDGKVKATPQKFGELENLLRDFIAQEPQTITSPKDLAQRMAGKAVLIKDVLATLLNDEEDEGSAIKSEFAGFRKNLIHDISVEDFADLYAETIAYGMFAARLHDETIETFSRHEALELLPKSNPFLRSLFTYVAGYDLDEGIAWIIDDLARVFRACDLPVLMQNFGKMTGQDDPFIHFYETFLAAYNPSKRKARGVWYTPQPVVKFIVRAVDEVLQTEFGLPDGLADTSKITIDWDTGQLDKKGKPALIKKEVHRVQVLDPATGTGTFLAEVIKQIAPKIQGVAPGMWSQYVEDDLIPRLHGFELLMASYAMCHMKLDMILTEMGYKPIKAPRLNVFLTNSLEEGSRPDQDLFSRLGRAISEEARGANEVKRDQPIMCVIGNPPYSGISQNMGDWITGLIEDYKYVDGAHFGERKHWLHDDYVKFIRLSESLIEKNGEGVLGFITNHGYLDNPTFRGMRWHLLNTFDRIHVLDLHGNAKKKEVTPEGKPDKNVFDIQQGVAIIIAVKTCQKKKGLAEVWHGDLWGTRAGKYANLEAGRIGNPITKQIDCKVPQYAFVPRDHALTAVYESGFGLPKIMPLHGVGMVTARDRLTIDESKEGLWSRIRDFAEVDSEIARQKFNLGKDVQSWKVAWAQDDVRSNLKDTFLTPVQYRPFDDRWTFYTGKSGGFICRPCGKVMRHMLGKGRLAICVSKQQKSGNGFSHALTHTSLIESSFVSNKTSEIGYSFPLYLYPDEQDLDQTRRVNFDRKLYKRLQEMAAHPDKGTPDEIAVFDYIYGVLHCPAYRKTYAEFLKVDFPRIPWPSSPDEFWHVSAKGTVLRKLHLMDPATIGPTPYLCVGEGDYVVDKPRFEDGKVWINKTQYFDNVPEVSWSFYIGGYQPAQKWLKDRKGREDGLSIADVKHYQKILKILSETDRIMQTIKMNISSIPRSP